MCNSKLIGCILACGPFLSPLAAEGNTVKLNGELEARVITLGRGANHQSLNITMNIANKGSNSAYLLLVGSPVVVDNTGSTFQSLQAVSGLALCRADFPLCIGVPNEREGITVPVENFTVIDPGVDVVVNFVFYGNGSKGPLISFSGDLAYRLADQAKDMNTSHPDKLKQVRRMNLSFPPLPVTDAR
jgi:hypothetical protein